MIESITVYGTVEPNPLEYNIHFVNKKKKNNTIIGSEQTEAYKKSVHTYKEPEPAPAPAPSTQRTTSTSACTRYEAAPNLLDIGRYSTLGIGQVGR